MATHDYARLERACTTRSWQYGLSPMGATPKRSLSVSSRGTGRVQTSTVKQVWPCHPTDPPRSCRTPSDGPEADPNRMKPRFLLNAILTHSTDGDIIPRICRGVWMSRRCKTESPNRAPAAYAAAPQAALGTARPSMPKRPNRMQDDLYPCPQPGAIRLRCPVDGRRRVTPGEGLSAASYAGRKNAASYMDTLPPCYPLFEV
jgi:hypothetical protein